MSDIKNKKVVKTAYFWLKMADENCKNAVKSRLSVMSDIIYQIFKKFFG